MPIFYLSKELAFPPINLAEEDGLLAVGGDLSLERLELAYRSGLFPWFNEGDPIMWWSPNPRCVLYPQDFRRSKSFKRLLRKDLYTCTMNKAFAQVVTNCKNVSRKDQEGTWITNSMLEAYIGLHIKNIAHSVEVWSQNGELVGGIYGVSIGKVFFGESMFSKVSNGSKVAMSYLMEYLIEKECSIMDCQVYNPHLESLGATEIEREKFLSEINRAIDQNGMF